VFFPGTPEPDGFDCGHGGTGWLIEFGDDKAISAEQLACGAFRFVTDSFEVHDASDIRAVVDRYDVGYERALLKLKVTGHVARDEYPLLRDLASKVEQRVFQLTRLEIDVREEIAAGEIDAEFTAGSLPHKLLTKLSEDEADWEALQIAYQMIQDVRAE
jgi:hypothetical protein